MRAPGDASTPDDAAVADEASPTDAAAAEGKATPATSTQPLAWPVPAWRRPTDAAEAQGPDDGPADSDDVEIDASVPAETEVPTGEAAASESADQATAEPEAVAAEPDVPESAKPEPEPEPVEPEPRESEPREPESAEPEPVEPEAEPESEPESAEVETEPESAEPEPVEPEAEPEPDVPESAEPEPEPVEPEAEPEPKPEPREPESAEPAEPERVPVEPEVVDAEPAAKAQTRPPAPSAQTHPPAQAGPPVLALPPVPAGVAPPTLGRPLFPAQVTSAPVGMQGAVVTQTLAQPAAVALEAEAPVFEPEAPALEPVTTPARRRAWWFIAAAVLVVAGGYVGLAWWFGQTVPSGARVLDVPIGGLSAGQAADELRDALADRVDDPVSVQVGDAVTTIPPTGLSIDYEATVAQVAGFSLNPVHLIRHIAGLDDVEPVVNADRDGVRAAVATVEDDVTTPAVTGQVAFVDGVVTRTPGADGFRVPATAAAEVLAQEWLRASPIELPTDVVHPEVSEKELDEAEAVAHTVLSGPVTIQVDGHTATLTATDIAAAARFVPKDGALVLTIDGAELDSLIRAQLPGIGSAPVNASAGFVNGQPALVEGTPGTGMDRAALGQAVATAAASTTHRTATVALTEVQPDVTLATLAQLGIKEKVSEFATPYPHDPQRTINLTTGAAAVNGTLLKPGEQFSLSDTLGRLTTDRGYVASGVVTNGVAEMEVGGGVSQISTTTYNAAYFAGLRLDEHKPHSRYFSRYPEGREATVYYPSVDMKFTNTTPHGILIQAWLADEHVHVAMWSTKIYDVTSDTSARYGFTSPGTVHNSRADCTPQRAGQGGFSVDDTRTIKDLNGNVLSVEKQTTTYAPVNAVICDR